MANVTKGRGAVSDNISDIDRWVDERELAKLLALRANTLRNWRARGIGPPYSRLGKKAIRYRVREVFSWAESQGM